MAARITSLVAILLFQILENYNLNKVTVFLEDLLPHKISGWRLTGASVTCTSDIHVLNIFILLKIQNQIRDGMTYNGMLLTCSSLNCLMVQKLFVEIAT
jgi:hypothetical protein